MNTIIKVHDEGGRVELQVICSECERHILIDEDQAFCPLCYEEIEQLNIKAWYEYSKEYEAIKCTNTTQK